MKDTRMLRFHAPFWRAFVGAMVVVVMAGGGMTAAAASDRPGGSGQNGASHRHGASESFIVDVPESPKSDETIGIDVDLYLPESTEPAPAVLLAHGFGGSKTTLDGDAERLRRDGFVVMTYSARGFGDSGGRISLDAVDFEVADASRLVDVLATRSEVEKRDGDPVVGVYGPSYGGALALMLGATDPRIDTVVASVTWNDLAQALVPRADPTSTEPGVFKEAWATQLFGAASSPQYGACGRFTAEFCALYTKLVGGERLDSADQALLAASSPASVLKGMTAPTLLLQGRQDTLFGFDQSDANARQIAAAGAPVTVAWFAGGHDAGLTRGSTGLVDDWLTENLMGQAASGDSASGQGPSGADSLGADSSGAGSSGAAGDPSTLQPGTFLYTVPSSARGFAETRLAPRYPGLDGDGEADAQRVDLSGRPRVVVNPPGALPATISSLPGTGQLDSFLAGRAAGIAGAVIQPAQVAGFTSEPLTDPFILAGSPTVTVDVGLPRDRDGALLVDPATSTRDVVLFAQLRVLSGDSSIAVGGGVVPMRVTLPADGSIAAVPVTLPATTWRFEAGDRIRLSLRTTDAGYQGSTEAATFFVDADGTMSLPTVASSDPEVAGGSPSTAAIVGIAIVVLVGLLLALLALLADRRRDRRRPRGAGVVTDADASAPDDASDDPPPLVIRGLTKNYRNGFRAVDDLSFTVQRGQVLGLLGPNGAGKTTALRMVTGLLRPDSGEARIFGELVLPGSRVLTRVGCFIEGPGFLSHLCGRRNLQLFWAASGRPLAEARLDEALDIADLGSAIDRRVGGYSQGMRQRLAIAQAMLGMPELLILDEPTNGLDPPQIFALRGVLRRYAESGRTVIVSSHLLGEVEQTCSDVVVMARGRLLASGTVAELAGDTNELTVEVTDVAATVLAVERLTGASSQVLDSGAVRILPGENSAEGVVSAIVADGIGVRSVTRGRHLEETFLAMVGSEGIS